MNLPSQLDLERERIRGYVGEYGLDPFETIFEVVDLEELNMIAAYEGFPTRYPHWRFGMEYEQLRKTSTYGLGRIYELVINNDPCYAYLLKSNALLDQKLVICHVYAHSDFFRNNFWFAGTNRHMIDEVANHAARIRSYGRRFGRDAVELFLDRCMSLGNLIDRHQPFIRRHEARAVQLGDPDLPPAQEVPRLKSKEYMQPFVNPREFMDRQRKSIEKKMEQEKAFPAQPEADLLLFLLENAPLERWQRDILSVIREEAYYFLPQAMTKIMNEGWAAYWHSRMMTEKVAASSEIVDYADHHSGTVAVQPGQLNPYKLGMELFRDIEERWDRGRFGSEYEACQNEEERRTWDRGTGLGRQKIFEVRRVYNDVTFIDEFLTPEFCRAQKMFSFNYDRRAEAYKIESRAFRKIKRRLLTSLTNCHQPIIRVVDGNYANRGELYLAHQHEGVDLEEARARDTLLHLQAIWKRPVHIETSLGDKGRVLSFDGQEHKAVEKKLPAAAAGRPEDAGDDDDGD
jgi:stage V sporulation protein R